MKGRTSHACRAHGGTTKMRSIGGFKAPRMGENEHVLKEAKGKTTGIVKMDGPDGDVAKKRLDRPGRKHGGKVHHMEHHKKHGGHVKHHEEHEFEHKHGGHVKEHHGKMHHEKHEHEEHHKHGGHVKKK